MSKAKTNGKRSGTKLADDWVESTAGEAGAPDLTPEEIVLPPREPDAGYVRPPMTDQTFIPEVY